MAEGTAVDPKESALEASREYAWDWFDLHAKQRQQSFHFYLILITAVVGAYYLSTRQVGASSPTQQYSAVPLVVSFIAAIFSYLFYRLDRRNRMLIRYAEAALISFEKDLAEKLGESSAPRMLQCAADPSRYQCDYVPMITTYGDIYRIIFAVGGIAGLIGMKVSWPPDGMGRLLNSLFV